MPDGSSYQPPGGIHTVLVATPVCHGTGAVALSAGATIGAANMSSPNMYCEMPAPLALTAYAISDVGKSKYMGRMRPTPVS